MKKILILLIISVSTFAQSVEITPGSILPQVTTAQRTSIASPKNGMLVFDTNTQSYWFRQSGGWTELPKGGSTNNYWQLTGNSIKNTNSGGFWSENAIGLNNLSNNTTNPPTAPAAGNGTRMMWIPSRSAFRAGTVVGGVNSWNANNIGLFSTAFGYNTRASEKFSTAMGYNTTASGYSSTAMGESTRATGQSSTAMGHYTIASGYSSTAMGSLTGASGEYSTAMGSITNASGIYSTAVGHKVTAEGRGSFIIGDYVSDITEPVRVQSTDNRFTARFRGGYFFMTSGNMGTITGVQLAPNGTAWGSISDSTKKENFIKADGEEFLKKLSTLKLGSWNYKGVEGRHYGPMAQEIFSAFGTDKLGTIGSDTLVNTLDMDGLLFIFAQALYEENEKLKNKNEHLEAALRFAQNDIDNIKSKNETLTLESSQLTNKFDELNLKLNTLIDALKTEKTFIVKGK
jgi:hypothetical protein